MNLQKFFQEHPKVALGFSGGVDSSYLFYAAKKYGADVRGYFIKSQFQPKFELDDAKKLAAELGIEFTVVDADVLRCADIAVNPSDRCYHCKNAIFSALIAAAKSDGYDTIIDGTNASDDASDRPGMRALAEMRVLSPLRLCGLTKSDVRELSKEAGLFTWDKPANACLATRIPTGEEITWEKLQKVESAEAALMKMGYSDFRVRYFHGAARLQFNRTQWEKAAMQRADIRAALTGVFDTVLMDLEER